MKDFDIRAALKAELERQHAGEADTRIVEELGVLQGARRADLAVINGAIHGYEIKSTRDTLERLEYQASAYASCFDGATIVLDVKHLVRCRPMIPDWWGITVAHASREGVWLEPFRKSGPNPSVRAESVVQLLWREETLAALKRIGAAAGVSGQNRRKLWNTLVEAVELDELRQIVRESIKARGDWRTASRLARSNDSSPKHATEQARRANLEWLLSHESLDRPSNNPGQDILPSE